MEFALKHEVDFIAPSGIRKGQDVEDIREVLAQSGSGLKIVAKINSHEALQNYDEILAAADAVMIVRTDLGMEIPLEKVYVAQKWMLEKANIASKPAIIATQALESMVNSSRPSRAEAVDIGNCVADGADCICLGEEVASGDFPANALTCLSKICVETERTLNYKKIYNELLMYTPTPVSNAEAMAQTVCQALIEQEVALIVNITLTGKIPRLLAKYRPSCKILSAAPENVLRSMGPLRGVQVFIHPDLTADNAAKHMIEEAKGMGLCKIGDKVAIVNSSNDDQENEENDFQLLSVS
jgi:pyruvate kinase